MKTYEQITSELDAKIPRDAVSLRESGFGKKLSYLEGHYVINRLNQVLGQGNWGYEIKSLNLVHSTEETVHYISQISFYAILGDRAPLQFTDVGYGDGKDRNNIGKAHELATKEAVTDGLKRCAKNLGMSMGLALYNKEQTDVEDEIITSTTTNGRGASAQTESGGANSTAPAKANGRAGSGASNRKSASLSNTKRELIRAAATTLNEMGVIDLASFKKEFILTKGVDSLDQMQDTDIEALLTTVTTKYPQLQLN